MCNFPQRREMFLAKMGGEEGGMGREQGRQHLGLEALSKNRRSCPLRHKMISSGNGPKRMTSSEIPQCQKAKHINTMWKLLFYITPPRGNLCSTGKPFSSSYGFWYICFFFFNLYWICYNIAAMCWFSGQEACGILVPWPGIEPELGGKVLTTEPPGMSLWYIYHKINPVTIGSIWYGYLNESVPTHVSETGFCWNH